MSDEVPVRRVKRDVTSTAPVTVIGTKMADATEQLLAYVNDKIKLVENKLLFNGDREPSLYELNKAIAEWPHVHGALTALYEQAAYDLEIQKHSYDEYFNDKFVEVREFNNNMNKDKKVWLSQREIEIYTNKQFKTELASLQVAIQLAERQKSIMLRLIEGWNSYQFQLATLSRNSCTEMQGDLKADKLNFNPND